MDGERARRATWRSGAIVAAIVASSGRPIAAQTVEPGYTSLFDGKSLAGWVTRGGRYDGDAAWSVEEGCIVGRQGANGAGGLLYTEKRYTSFDLRLETKLDHPFDSGVFLRMAPEGKGAQVTLDWRPDGEIGGIYSDGYLMHNEAAKAKFKADAWNDLRVRCTGFDMRIEVWLNGERITDFQMPPESPGYAPTGLIGVQVHGARDDAGAARFRNLRVKELPLFGDDVFATRPEAPLTQLLRVTERGKEAGWRSLLEGGLDGWEITGESDRYTFQDGVLGFQARGEGGHLATKEDFRDFRLRLDFRPARMTNSGVFLRAARDGSNPAFSGCEVQILDDFHWEAVTKTKLEPWQFCGSLYGAVPAGKPSALRPMGEWSTFEILYRGSRLAVALNGRTLYDVDTLSLTPFSGEPFEARARTGFIGLQHHGAHNIDAETMISFRNVFVQPLQEQ